MLPDLTEAYLAEHLEPAFEATRQRYRDFARFYLTNGRNASKAAKQAGYAPVSAHVQGHRLLKVSYIRQLIRSAIGEDLEEQRTIEEGVLETLTAIRKTRLRDLIKLDVNGNPEFDLLSMTDDQAIGVRKIKILRGGDIEIELESKVKAAELLGKHKGMFVEKRELSGPGGTPLLPAVINVSFKDPEVKS